MSIWSKAHRLRQALLRLDRRDRRRQRRLAVIDVADRADVHVRLRPLEFRFAHSCPLIASYEQRRLLPPLYYRADDRD